MRTVVRTTILSCLVGGASGVACGMDGDGRGGAGPGIPGGGDEPPVSFIEEEDYGPVAQYLAANANYPLEQGGNADGGGDDGGGDDDGDGADDGGGDAPGDGGDGASCNGFSCNSGECIDATWKCDQIVDCPGGEDEEGCPSSDDGGDGDGDGGGQTCDGFQCNDGTCIINEWKCDQYDDCAGGEDEAGCPSSDGGGDGGDGGDGGGTTCDGFECNDGVCIDSDWVCDELVDCQGGEDESGCQIAPGGPVGLDPDFAAANDTQAVSGSCLAMWTTAGATTGSLAAKAATTSCTGGGVLLGFVSGGTTLGAAAVCFVGNVTNADVVAGGVFGALSGLTGGLIFCEGGALDLATSVIRDMVESKPVPVYKIKPKDKACEPCAIPATPPEPARVDCVPPSKPHHPCKSHHWHVYSWQVNQNPETCECHNNKREEVLCYDPVGDPDIASDPLWNVCL